MEKNRENLLTPDEINSLVCYILMTTNHRKRERETWEQLATETTPDGSPMYPHAADNAKYWAEKEIELQQIKEKLDKMY